MLTPLQLREIYLAYAQRNCPWHEAIDLDFEIVLDYLILLEDLKTRDHQDDLDERGMTSKERALAMVMGAIPHEDNDQQLRSQEEVQTTEGST